MTQKFLFRTMATLTIWLYSASMIQAGQVVTRTEKSWAKQAASMASQEKDLAPVASTNTLAVLYYRNLTGQANLNALQKGLSVMLITDLAKVDKLQVVERIKLQALLDELHLGESGLVDPATAPKVGRMLGAYYVAAGDIVAGKFTKIQFNPNIVDVPFKTVTEQVPAVGELSELIRIEKEILFNTIKQMNIFLTPEEKAELEKPLSASTAALFALFTAIDYSDKGDYAKAAELYHEALVEDPHLQMAGDALQELKDMGLLSQSAIQQPAGQTTAAEAAVEGGPSVGKVLGVALGVGLVGGGIALALSGGGSSSSSNQDQTTEPPSQTDNTPPTVVSTVPADGSSVECSGDTITFNFSEPMDTSSGNVNISIKDWNVDSAQWSGNTSYVVSWQDSTADKCNSSNTEITVTLNRFRDAAGNSLGSGYTTYGFSVSGTY